MRDHEETINAGK